MHTRLPGDTAVTHQIYNLRVSLCRHFYWIQVHVHSGSFQDSSSLKQVLTDLLIHSLSFNAIEGFVPFFTNNVIPVMFIPCPINNS